MRKLAYTLVAVLVLLAAWPLWIAATWPDVESLANENPNSTAFIDRARDRLDGDVAWQWVPDRRISPQLRKAIVAAEDTSFFSHQGFDQHEIEKALDDALEGKRVRGASTITQQLAKNLWLTPSRSPIRKIKEALLTSQLEEHLDKRRILELYTNVVEFGPGIYGAEAAARHYFGKASASLSADEAAQLAAALPSSTWHPGVDSQSYRAHLGRVRERMRQYDWLDDLVR